jgi:hypothetical protein
MIKTILLRTMKQAILCGIGMAVDMSGTSAPQGQPLPPEIESIGQDFREVGNCIEAGILEEKHTQSLHNAKQMSLKLQGG